MPDSHRRLSSRLIGATYARLVLAFELLEHFVGKKLVGDVRDLFSFLPRFGKRRELSFESAALDVFVRCHLQGQPVDRWKSKEGRRLFAAGAAAPPERTIGELQRDSFGEARCDGLDQSLV